MPLVAPGVLLARFHHGKANDHPPGARSALALSEIIFFSGSHLRGFERG